MISAIMTTANVSFDPKEFAPLRAAGSFTVIEEVLRNLVQSPVGEIIVVTGYQRRVIERLLERRPCRFVHDWSWYLGDAMTSVRQGLNAVSEGSTAALVCSAHDLSLRPQTVAALVARMQENGSDKLYRQAAGSDASLLIPARFWPDLRGFGLRRSMGEFLQTQASAIVDVSG